MQAAISRAKAYQDIEKLNEKLRKQTWIELRNIKKIVTDKNWFWKVIEVKSPAMIDLIMKEDLELTNSGYFDHEYNVQLA